MQPLRPRRNRRRSVSGGNFPVKDCLRLLTELPTELQSDILLRLPVKSLLFCKCVCKSLRTLISNPNFVQSHLASINSSPKSLIFQFGYEKQLMLYTTTRNPNVSSLSLDPVMSAIDKPHEAFVVGSCNGLILIGARFGSIHKLDYVLILWNPVIGQHRYLPEPNFRCTGFHGFGFIPETNDYVILKVSSIQRVIEVYKMSTDSWIAIDCSSRGAYLISKPGGDVEPIYFNGSFHWTEETIYDTDIVYYNLKDEELGVIKAINYDEVSGYEKSRIRKKVVVVDHSLAMIYWVTEHTFPFEMWVMNDYGVEETWTRRFLIDRDVSNYVECSLAGLWTSGLMIIKELSYYRGRGRAFKFFSTLLSYDLNTRSRMKIARMEKICYITGFCNFVETLVPVIKVCGLLCFASSFHGATIYTYICDRLLKYYPQSFVRKLCIDASFGPVICANTVS